MPRLFAAEHRAGRLQLLEDVAVAHLRLDDGDPMLAHSDLKTDVRHDGRDDGRQRQFARRLHLRCGDRHDHVAVHLGAGLVDGQHPVGVAVVSDAEIGVGR